MKKFLLYLWQLPQNLIGLFMSTRNILTTKRVLRHYTTLTGDVVVAYLNNRTWGSAVSLGQYIIADYHYYDNDDLATIKTISHEHGHQKQSLYLGPLYLLIIGLPSALGNLWCRWNLKRWGKEKYYRVYYSQPWEKWADKLGGVTRN